MCHGFESHPSSSFFFSEKKELFGLVAFPFFLFIEKSFHVSMVALRKAGLNKKQRGESRLVSCFISTSNTLAMEHPGYHDMKGWGKDKQSHDCPLSSTLRYCHSSTCIVVFRTIGQQE